MAAINGANAGLGLVTLGLETDFPEDARNVDPGTENVRYGVGYTIHNEAKTGAYFGTLPFGAGGAVTINAHPSGGTVLGSKV